MLRREPKPEAKDIIFLSQRLLNNDKQTLITPVIVAHKYRFLVESCLENNFWNFLINHD